jgi:hypothetical protein
VALSGGDPDDRPVAGRRGYVSGDGGDFTQVTLARLEAKFDTLAQVQTMRHEALTNDIKHIRETQLTTSSDHELRIRTLEQKSIEPARVFALEQRRYVEPKTVITAITILTGLGVLVIAIINAVTR